MSGLGLFVLVGLASGVVVVAGAAARERGLGVALPLALLVCCTGAAAFGISTLHEPDVPRRELVEGVILGAVTVCALPLAVYYALGRLVRDPRVVIGVWLASVVPLGFWLFAAWIITLGYVACGPEAYECPL